jgi:hypothetical protein
MMNRSTCLSRAVLLAALSLAPASPACGQASRATSPAAAADLAGSAAGRLTGGLVAAVNDADDAASITEMLAAN